ncbi:hypothetical protein [Nonomuraea dietziae]|uniref:hypothetical protein n=1 Tax=Nonomuraea dietziae TaxID=65515 RepID=UPI0033C3B1B9
MKVALTRVCSGSRRDGRRPFGTQQAQSQYGGAEHSGGGAQEGRGQDGSTAAAATERRASSDAVTGIAEA